MQLGEKTSLLFYNVISFVLLLCLQSNWLVDNNMPSQAGEKLLEMLMIYISNVWHTSGVVP